MWYKHDEKCKHCKKKRGLHQASTLACPTGTKTRIGYTSFSTTNVFEWDGKEPKEQLFRL